MKKKLVLGLLALSLSTFALEMKGNKVIGGNDTSIDIKEYNRVIVIDPAVIETMYMLGAEDKIVGIAKSATAKIWPEEKTDKLPSVGTVSKATVEEIVAKNPDLVITFGMGTGIIDVLRQNKIPVLVNDGSTSIDNVIESITIYGKLFGKEKEAAKLRKESLAKLEKLKETNEKNGRKLKGILLYTTSPMMAFNSTYLPGQVIELVGIENLANNVVGARPIISQEFLLENNPDIILAGMTITKPEDLLKANPAIKATTAGKNNNIFIVDSKKVLRGSARIFTEIEKLAEEIKNVKI